MEKMILTPELERITHLYYDDNAKKLHSTVDKILKKLGIAHMSDNGDFYSLANEVFTDLIRRYDEKKDFDNFLYSCLLNKFKTEMTKRNRIKRTSDRMAISLETPIGDEDGLIIEDVIPGKDTVESIIFNVEDNEWSFRIRTYLDGLSPLQRKIAILLSEDVSSDEICKQLHITKNHFNNSFKRITSDEKTKILNKNKEGKKLWNY